MNDLDDFFKNIAKTLKRIHGQEPVNFKGLCDSFIQLATKDEELSRKAATASLIGLLGLLESSNHSLFSNEIAERFVYFILLNGIEIEVEEAHAEGRD